MDYPPFLDPDDAARQRMQALRYRMLYGSWGGDLKEAIIRSAGHIRADVWGDPDIASNPLLASAAARATLYDEVDEQVIEIDPVTQERRTTTIPRGPQVVHPDADPEVVALMRDICRDGGLFPTLQAMQRDTLGIRDMLCRVDVTAGPAGPELVLQPVFPHLVQVDVDPRRPTELLGVKQWGRREIGGREEWTAEVWSVAKGVGKHAVVMQANGRDTDVSADAGLPPGGVAGEAYPTRDAAGVPVLPFVAYHARRGGCFWDPSGEAEIVVGTLQVGKYLTYFDHTLLNAAYRQRYTIDAEPVGVGEQKGRRTMVADPSALLSLRSTTDQGGSQIGSFEAPVDPLQMFEAILAYERRLAGFAGLDPADVQRASGDPRSGYALAISMAGKIRQARRYAPTFRVLDAQLMRLIAVRLNAAFEQLVGVRPFPETGWSIDYPIARIPIPQE